MKKITLLLSVFSILLLASCSKDNFPCAQYENFLGTLFSKNVHWGKVGPQEECNVVKIMSGEDPEIDANALTWKSIFEANLGTDAVIKEKLPPLNWHNQEIVGSQKIAPDTIASLYSLEFDGGLNLMMHFVQYKDNSFEVVSYSLSASDYVPQAEKNLGFTYDEIIGLDSEIFAQKAEVLKQETIRLFLSDNHITQVQEKFPTITIIQACDQGESMEVKNFTLGDPENSSPALFPLDIPDQIGVSYILKNDILSYVATLRKAGSEEITLDTRVYEYDCKTKTNTEITVNTEFAKEIPSGLYASTRVQAASDKFLILALFKGEYLLPGTKHFYLYSREKKEFTLYRLAGLKKYKKKPEARYVTTVEDVRIVEGTIEMNVVVNDAGENIDPTSIPEYKLLSEKWVKFDPNTNSLQ